MATTTNFGWETPDDTDLVKDGAAAIRTSLNGVDSSFVDLKGGTTGQVLSKASATDLDFTWVAQDDSNAIQNAIVDAKGDLIVGASADTPARLAVGTNGYVLTANSSATNGVEWASAASGGQTLLSTTTLSGASTTISVAGGYNDLKVVIYAATCASAGYLAFKPNNSSSISSYWTAYQNGAAAAGPEYKYNSTWDLDQGYSYQANNNENVNEIYITQYASTATMKPCRSLGRHVGASSQGISYFANGAISTTSAITSLVFSNSGGNFTGGTVLVYGVK